MSDRTILGPYLAGEIPEPWVHQFETYDGTPIDLTSFAVKLTYRVNSGAQVVRDGTLVDAANGKASYGWVADDLAAAGIVEGEMTVGDGTNRYARGFTMRVNEPRGGALPAI